MTTPVITSTLIDPAKLTARYGQHSSRVCLFLLQASPPVQERYRVWFFAEDSSRVRFCEDYERFIITSWPKNNPQ